MLRTFLALRNSQRAAKLARFFLGLFFISKSHIEQVKKRLLCCVKLASSFGKESAVEPPLRVPCATRSKLEHPDFFRTSHWHLFLNLGQQPHSFLAQGFDLAFLTDSRGCAASERRSRQK